MADEQKEVKAEECKCFCKSEGVRKFLVVALGTFVGVYAALSLFVATHRPPMRPPHHMHMPPIEQRGQIQHPFKGDLNRVRFEKRDFRGELPARFDVKDIKK